MQCEPKFQDTYDHMPLQRPLTITFDIRWRSQEQCKTNTMAALPRSPLHTQRPHPMAFGFGRCSKPCLIGAQLEAASTRARRPGMLL